MKRFDQINVIPFIDIMLVLLAIVLTTASFISQGLIPVELPQVSKTSTPIKSSSINISINHQGEIFIDKELKTLIQLESFLKAQIQKSKIQLRIDKQTDFNHFVLVAQSLKTHQFEQVSIVVNERVK